jgi:serpin B
MKRLALALSLVLVAACGPAASQSPSATPASTDTAATFGPTASPTQSPSSVPSPTTVAAGMIREVRADVARTGAGDPGGSTAQAVAAADAAFALRLYHELATGKGNLIYSPYSISTALSMTYGGAGGATAEQLATALGVGADPIAWHAGRNDVDGFLERPQPVDPDSGVTPLTIEPTNALFGQDGFAFRPAYLELLASDYGAGLQAVDFIVDAEAARAAINRWVAERTKDRISELLGPATVSEATRFVLVNAIYFKGSWAYEFEKKATKAAAFNRLDGTTVNAPIMHGTFAGDYVRGNGWQAVDIPYVGATMTVILPDAGRFDAVERQVDPAFLAELKTHPAFDFIHLGLPRWSSSTDVDLVENLKKLGVRDLFDPGAADLRGIADAGLYVSRVIHQATITVDEHGTEAAAATAVVGDTSGGGPDGEVSVAVDRPFLYVIRDGGTGEILFVGRVLDPTLQ